MVLYKVGTNSRNFNNNLREFNYKFKEINPW